jgi:type IV secretion system protein VirD4
MRRTYVPLAVLAALLLAGSDAAAQFYGGQPQFNPYRGPTAESMFASRLGTLLAGAIIGGALGAFFSPAFRQARMAILAGIAFLASVFALFGPFPIADIAAFLVSIVVGLLIFGLAIRLGRQAARAAALRRLTSFGSARWATAEYLTEHGALGTTGFALGEFRTGMGTTPLHYQGARHLLTVAPTRSGKGVSSIIPNLLTYAGSALIVDPKGENALVTALRRGAGGNGIPGMGQGVFLLDPWNIAAGKLGMTPACFNPLDWITADDPDAAENAFLLADAFVPEENKSGGENRFWDDETKALLTGLILYVATAPEEEGNRTLGRVRDILVMAEEGLLAVLENMLNHPNPIVSSTAERTAGKDAKLRSNILTGAQAHTHWLDSPRIRASLERSDFRFEDLRSAATSIYLILPADRLKTFDRWLRLLVQQAITVNARDIERKPEKPVLFLLDEMAAIGKLSSVEQAYGLMAGFGLQLWGIVQDLSQLERIYGKGWQTFISNSGVIQYFGSRDKMTAEYFSTLCGVTTIIVENLSTAIGQVFGYSSTSASSGGGSSTSSESSSDTTTTSFNESQRKLAYPDELMVMRGNRQIVFIENLDPISADKITWYASSRFRDLGVNLHKPLPGLTPSRLPPGMPEAPSAAAA